MFAQINTITIKYILCSIIFVIMFGSIIWMMKKEGRFN